MPLYDPRTQKPAALIPGRPYPRFWGPPPDMGFTFGSFACSGCKAAFSTQNGVAVHCPYCGTKVAQKTEQLEASELADSVKEAPLASTVLTCSACKSACVTDSTATEIAQMQKAFCTQCGNNMTSELAKLCKSQQTDNTQLPTEDEMLLSRKATVAVAKKLAEHGVEASIEKVSNTQFRVEAQAEMPESLSKEIREIVEDIDTLEQALNEGKDTSMARKVKAQEGNPVDPEVVDPEGVMPEGDEGEDYEDDDNGEGEDDDLTEESQNDEENPEEILSEEEVLRISSSLKSAGVAHTVTKVSENGYVIKAQEGVEPTEDDEAEETEPTEPEENAEGEDEGDEGEPMDDAQILSEREAQATSDALKNAGVDHTITRVKGGFIVRAQEMMDDEGTEEDSQYGVPPYTEESQSEEDNGDEEDAQYGVPPYTEESQSEDDMDMDVMPEDGEEDIGEDEILPEEAAIAVSRNLRKAGVDHTVTRVARNGYVVRAQEWDDDIGEGRDKADNYMDKLNDAYEDYEKGEDESKDKYMDDFENATDEILDQKSAEKASAALKAKGIKHSITRVSANGYVIAQLDDMDKTDMDEEESQYGVPPYTEEAQDEESDETDPEQSQEEFPSDEPEGEEMTEEGMDAEEPEEAVMHESLSDVDSLENVSVSDLSMTLYDEELDNPHYNLDVEGKPVAAIFLQDQPKPEELRASFVNTTVYAKNFCDAVEKLGLKEVLRETKARLWAAKVEKSKFAQDVRAKVEASFNDNYVTKVAEVKDNLVHALNIVFAGLNKNFFTDVDNPLKAALWSEMRNRGIDDAVEIIEAAFSSAADPFFKIAINKAEEVIAKPKDVVDELAKIIASVNTATVTETVSRPSYRTLGQRLSENSVPVVAQASTGRSRSREQMKADIKNRIRLGGTNR